MILKEYVVVKSATGSIDLWTKGVYEHYLKGHTIGDGTGAPYTAIITFDANEELKEGGGMPWVKASERVPDSWINKAVRFIHTKAMICAPEIFIPQQPDLLDQLEWLDEYAAQFAGTREEVERYKELAEAQKEYIDILTQELNRAIPMAAIHGYKSELVEAGEQARQRIQLATNI